MAYDFNRINPSTNLTWTPCFDDFTCAKLEVPLDYANTTLGTTPIAFMKLAGKNATATSPSIMIVPGGPGGSGIDLLRAYAPALGELLGDQYNYVSFDPRGVGNSGPQINCFSGNDAARSSFNRLHYTGATNTSTSSFETQYYSSIIYGEWCNNAAKNDSPYGYYVTTPAVARDLLTFVEAEAELAGEQPSEAKLWCYASSYGTVVGTTFATMFPDRVGRMVLDGIMDAEQYYQNDWTDNIDQSDLAMEKFSELCHAAGADACSFWGPSPGNITARLDSIIHKLQHHPVPISGVHPEGTPALVTYSDLQSFLMLAIYEPLTGFPAMAEIFHQLENGNASALIGSTDRLDLTTDAGQVIRCVDSYQRNKLVTVEDFKDYVDDSVRRSKYLGDIWPIFSGTILCTGFEPEVPDSIIMQGPTGLDKPTSFPMLFASNTVDPITPLISALKSSSRFPGSVVLLQEAVGHTVIRQQASDCYFGHVQAYLQGVVPSSNTTCPQQFVPFVDTPTIGI